MSNHESGTKKLLNFTKEDIKVYLMHLKSLVLEGKYTVSRNSNREENVRFAEDYKIDSKKEKEILMNLEYDDFCYAVNNTNPKFAYEILYIFNKVYELDKWGELVSVDIYIKTNKTQTVSGGAKNESILRRMQRLYDIRCRRTLQR